MDNKFELPEQIVLLVGKLTIENHLLKKSMDELNNRVDVLEKAAEELKKQK